jgi:hypothetical protein
MSVQIVPQDAALMPMIGPGGLGRDAARAEIQSVLDRLAAAAPAAYAPAAGTWRLGNVRDETLRAGLTIFCVYEHPAGQDPEAAAMEWLEDLAATMRSAGSQVTVARPRAHG